MSPFWGSHLKSVLGVGFDLAFELHPAKLVLSFDLGFYCETDDCRQSVFSLCVGMCLLSLNIIDKP